ncbi:MAG TPA: kelch repeat-containing protein [Roseiflexaceae bacterium]|nr:kelch repeat-containing protein [Roseiflexaceae bacterium]
MRLADHELSAVFETRAFERHWTASNDSAEVLVAGGDTGFAVTTAELYTPAVDKWRDTGNMSTMRVRHSATLLPDGRVLVAGGYGGYGQVLNSVEIFDPVSNRWRPARPLASARAGHTATLLNDGTLLVVGGYGVTGPLNSAERYDPSDAVLGNQGYLPSFVYEAVPLFPTAPPFFPTVTPFVATPTPHSSR